MSIRSTIARLNEDRTVTSIRCEYDGYPSGVGLTLVNQYSDDTKVLDLLAQGDLTTLDNNVVNPTGSGSQDYMDVQAWEIVMRDDPCDYGYLWNGMGWSAKHLVTGEMINLDFV